MDESDCFKAFVGKKAQSVYRDAHCKLACMANRPKAYPIEKRIGTYIICNDFMWT